MREKCDYGRDLLLKADIFPPESIVTKFSLVQLQTDLMNWGTSVTS